MALWNSNSGGHVRLRFAGDTTETLIENAVVVSHHSHPCTPGLNPGARADAYDCRDSGSYVDMNLTKCNLATQTVSGPILWTLAFNAAATSYEAVLLHELGHAVFGFPDHPGTDGIMRASFTEQMHYTHLYNIDVASAQGTSGVTWLQPAVATTANAGVTWSSISTPFTYASQAIKSTIAPGTATRYGSADPVAVAVTNMGYWRLSIFKGTPGGTWTLLPTPSNATSGVNGEAAIAVSDPGEMLVAWVANCTRTGNYLCAIQWAWTANDGASWTTGTLNTNPSNRARTFTRPALAYDPITDHFIMMWIDLDAHVRTANMPAYYPGWSPDSADIDPYTFGQYRQLGGLIFRPNGQGVLTAGLFNTAGINLVQHNIVFNGTTGYHESATTAIDMNTTYWSDYRTNTSGGLAYRRDVDQTFA